MALASSGVWELRTAGSDNNAGYFNPSGGGAGTDYSQQNAAQKTSANLEIKSDDNTKIKAPEGVAAGDVRNGVRIFGGTGFTQGTYEITAQDGTWWTLDRAAGTTGSTGGSYGMGGAKLTLSAIDAALIGGNTVHVKSGTYDFGSAVHFGDSVGNADTISILGYNATRGDDPQTTTRPVFRATAAINLLSIDGFGPIRVSNLIFDGDGTGLIGLRILPYSSNAFGMVNRCLARNFVTGGFYGGIHYFGEAHDNGYGFGQYSVQVSAYACIARDNTSHGFGTTAGGTFAQCISARNGGRGFYNFGNASLAWFSACLAVGNTSTGFESSGGSCKHHMDSCIAYDNGAYGADGWFSYSHCAFGSNTSGAVNGTRYDLGGNVNLSADPFVDAANDDFNLNNTAGGGALLRAATFSMPG